jgi:glycosyltransferase involved in cell wall biosynthesis
VPKTLVCVNVLDNVNAQVYGSHCQEFFKLGRTTADEFILFYPNRLSIDNARNQAALLALNYDCDYLYFIDDDIILHPNTYQSLKDAKADIAAALTFIRGYPFHCMAFKRIDSEKLDFFDDFYEHVDADGLFNAEAVGFACALINCTMLRLINPPFFVTGTQSTEDVYFCLKLRHKLNNDVRIIVDAKVPTAHLLHPEAITMSNHEQLKKFYYTREIASDRGKDYLDQCKQTFHIS